MTLIYLISDSETVQTKTNFDHHALRKIAAIILENRRVREQYQDMLKREGRWDEIAQLQAMTDAHWYKEKNYNFTRDYQHFEDLQTCMCARADEESEDEGGESTGNHIKDP